MGEKDKGGNDKNATAKTGECTDEPGANRKCEKSRYDRHHARSSNSRCVIILIAGVLRVTVKSMPSLDSGRLADYRPHGRARSTYLGLGPKRRTDEPSAG